MNKDQFIEEKVKEFNEKYHCENLLVNDSINTFIRQSLQEAWEKGSTKGYRKALEKFT